MKHKYIKIKFLILNICDVINRKGVEINKTIINSKNSYIGQERKLRYVHVRAHFIFCQIPLCEILYARANVTLARQFRVEFLRRPRKHVKSYLTQ